MKQKLSYAFITFLLLIINITPVFAANNIQIFINGDHLKLDSQPVLLNNTTLVPMRSIFEALEINVEYNPETKQIIANKADTIIELTLNQNTAQINGSFITLNVAPQSINNTTFVPLRFISEALNCNIDWNTTTQTINIITKDSTQSNTNAETLYDVIRVVDGDTIVVNYNGIEEKVRFIGIDTPESVHPDNNKNTEEGKKAAEYTTSLLNNKAVRLEFDVQQRDKYGRLLAYVYLDNVMVNKTLLEEGLAEIATYPPNVKYVDDFTKIVSARNQSTNQITTQETTEKSTPTNSTNSTDNSQEISNTKRQYYRTPTGKRYHIDPNCNNGTYTPCTLEEALKSGLTPCGKCIG